ncbi:MAG: radical SAM protein [Clostridia bacterium]|nr:radical SAM protein [Clostridia bacterium]
MQIIKGASGYAARLLGVQIYDAEKEYRVSPFCIFVTAEDGNVLAANLLTREILLLSVEELAFLQGNRFCGALARTFAEKWYLVAPEFDAYETVERVRALVAAAKSTPDVILDYQILVTHDCNARCFYCYETDRIARHVPMSEKTANAVADYILAHAHGKRVMLRWHGGEPLYNIEAIRTIVRRLTAAGQDFISEIYTNGYLFDADIVREGMEAWHLMRVQISLDGTEEIYNTCKAYIYKDDPSPYQRVMRNIGLLLETGVTLYLRVNIDRHNMDMLKSLADELYARFGSPENLGVYAVGLYEDRENINTVRTADGRTEIVNAIIEFDNYCRRLGIARENPLGNNIKLRRCLADNPSAIQIFPEGQLSKCDHAAEGCLCGDVVHGVLSQEAVTMWRERANSPANCRGCAIYTDCIRLKNCRDDGPAECDASYKAERLHKLENAVRFVYRRYLRAAQSENGEEK